MPAPQRNWIVDCPACGAAKDGPCRNAAGSVVRSHAARVRLVDRQWAMAYCANEFYSVGPEGACGLDGCETCGGSDGR